MNDVATAAPASAAAQADAAPERCLNCGTPLGAPRPRYCGHCGQETHIRPPKFTEFVQQLGGAYFSTEGALWRTLGLLLFIPGELTRRYRAGRRKHYVLPLRLYITISLLALVALRLVMPVNFKAEDAVKFDDNAIFLDLGGGRTAGLRDGKFICEQLPEWFCTRLERRLDVDPKNRARELERMPERFINHWGTAMFLLLPVFALLMKLAYLGSGLRYTEHAVYALHVHSFWFAALALALLPVPAVAAAMAVAAPLYTLIAARRVYGGGWFGTLVRAALVALAYFVILGVALAVVLIWAFLS